MMPTFEENMTLAMRPMKAPKHPVHIYFKNGVWVAARMYDGWAIWPYGHSTTQNGAWDDFVAQMHMFKSPGWYHYDFARNYK